MNVNNGNNLPNQGGADVSILLEPEEIQKSEDKISETTSLLPSEDHDLHSRLSLVGRNHTGTSGLETQTQCYSFVHQNRSHRNSSASELSDETIVKLNINKEFRDLPTGKKYHFYVSYSSIDSTEVKKICGQVEKRYFLKCLNYDRDFTPGKRLDQNIYDEMTQSAAVLLVLSPNFVDSLWCMAEAHAAFDLSFKSKKHLKVIPILITTPNEELPSLLRYHRYIDARALDDIPAKIYEVYCYPAAINIDCIEQTVDVSGQNGASMWYFLADRQLHICGKVNTFEFAALTEAKVERITAYSPNCEEQVRAVISYVNNHTLMKYYRILSNPKCICLGFLLVFLVAALIPLALGSFIITKRRDTAGSTGLVLMYVGAVVISIAIGCLFVVLYKKIQSKWLIDLQTGIWNINIEHFESSKCLVEFKNYIDYPVLEGTRYDTSKCKERLCSLLEKTIEEYDEEAIKVNVDTRIKDMLKVLQFKGFRDWMQLEECQYNIHNTWKDRKCLCQIIEKDL